MKWTTINNTSVRIGVCMGCHVNRNNFCAVVQTCKYNWKTNVFLLIDEQFGFLWSRPVISVCLQWSQQAEDSHVTSGSYQRLTCSRIPARQNSKPVIFQQNQRTNRELKLTLTNWGPLQRCMDRILGRKSGQSSRLQAFHGDNFKSCDSLQVLMSICQPCGCNIFL